MIDADALKERFIPFAALRYSTEAFVDYAIPECTPKYNYALIGPGVSQNPNQPINLREQHGFQVGGVSIPHGKVNPPHMHFTCEVFLCARGDWRLEWGFNPEPLAAALGEYDIVSVPTWIYRSFINTGADDGFMFTVLGGDSTGGILWGPSTLAAAAAQGVLLTEDYRIVDTRRGEQLAAGERLIQPMTTAEIAALRVWSEAEMASRVVRFADLRWSANGLLDSALPGCGGQLAPAIGLGMVQDRDCQAPISNAHGMSVEWLRIPAGGGVSRHRLAEKQVLITQSGSVELAIDTRQGQVSYPLQGGAAGWDSFALPADCWRSLRNSGPDPALVLLLTGGDQRKHIHWSAEVVDVAAAQGMALDANGYVAPRHFVERAQR